MAKQRVGIVMGSDSDWPVMEKCYKQLADLGLEADVQVLSAHRTPDQVRDWIIESEQNGVQVFIAGAGMAAALPGVVAAHTSRPVIGVPLVSGDLAGLDALMSIVQMPPGVPVATVAVGGAGAKNAAILAAQMIALGDKALAKKMKDHKRDQAAGVEKKNQALQEKLRRG
jgi:phosphoribosylaminoimidazole carboxylase PurE protein